MEEALAGAIGLSLFTMVKKKAAPVPTTYARSSAALVHGANAAGARFIRRGFAFNIQGVAHVTDNEAFVCKMVLQESKPPPSSSNYPDVRLAFLGGTPVVEHYVRRASLLKTVGERVRFIETFGRVRSAAIVQAIVSLTTSTKAKKEAVAWLHGHAEYARPIVSAALFT